jgi:hypothetical protein
VGRTRSNYYPHCYPTAPLRRCSFDALCAQPGLPPGVSCGSPQGGREDGAHPLRDLLPGEGVYARLISATAAQRGSVNRELIYKFDQLIGSGQNIPHSGKSVGSAWVEPV